ncbi:MAG: YraN family protein [Desulfonauticus sp.]|nr:YraN family protein [Desulfonauticus sp.]
MVARHISVGRKGEILAQEYLISRGYSVLQTNFRCSFGEIDIICTKNDFIVFVEVRVRKKQGIVAPGESLTKEKFNKLYKTACYYLDRHKLWEKKCRFDFIGISFSKDSWSIEHVPNVWQGESFCCSHTAWQPW